MRAEKLLIIGGSGLVGTTLIQYAKSIYEIHLIINKDKNLFDEIPATKIDLLEDRLSVINLIKNLKPYIVVNTAAFASVDLCETNPHLANLLHIDITQDIVNACKDVGSKMIHFSTDAVFDGKLDRKYNESDVPNPINHYGKTRLIAESIVTNASCNNVVLRTAVIYGWHPRSRFTNWIIQTLKENKVVDPFLDQHNTPTLVDDLALSILKIIESDISGLFHAVGPTCLSRYEFALRIAEKFGFDKKLIKPVTSNEKKQDAKRPFKTCLDASKLERLVGYKFRDVDKGIDFILSKSKEKSN